MYNPRVRVESLLVSAISQASAKQRAGRAGRTQPGKCFRLYTEASFYNDLQVQSHPEILRSKMETVVLTLLKLGIEDLVHFDFMDPPAPETMMRALEQLNYLGALDDEGNLTPLGIRIGEIPVEPQLAKMLVTSAQYKCTNEIVSIVALLSTANIFMRPKEAAKLADESKSQYSHPDGDHITMLHAYLAYKDSGSSSEYCFDNFLNYRSLQSADSVRDQLSRQLRGFGIASEPADISSPDYYINIRKCIASGLFMQVAHLQRQGHYLTAKDHQVVAIHPSSVLDTKPSWVCFQDFVLTTRNFIRTVTPIPIEWLIELAPHYFDLASWPEGETKSELESTYRRYAQTKKYNSWKSNK